MALLKRKKEESGQSQQGGAAAPAPEHRPPEQIPPSGETIGESNISPGLQRRWEEAWRRARGR